MNSNAPNFFKTKFNLIKPMQIRYKAIIQGAHILTLRFLFLDAAFGHGECLKYCRLIIYSSIMYESRFLQSQSYTEESL